MEKGWTDKKQEKATSKFWIGTSTATQIMYLSSGLSMQLLTWFEILSNHKLPKKPWIVKRTNNSL